MIDSQLSYSKMNIADHLYLFSFIEIIQCCLKCLFWQVAH